jgi:hypothetical protein
MMYNHFFLEIFIFMLLQLFEIKSLKKGKETS